MNNLDLLTNFDVIQRPIYEKALEQYQKETSDYSLYITDEAYLPITGQIAKDMNALRCTTRKDRSKFWRMFDEIKKERRD